MDNISAIILAAGLGKRMKSDLPKVMHCILGIPMIEFEIRMLEKLGIKNNILVVGHKKEILKTHFQNRVKYVFQPEQLGTGHAVRCVLDEDLELSESVIILCGDTPMLRQETIDSAIQKFYDMNVDGAVLSVELENPFGYGRIVHCSDNSVDSITSIIEEKDANESIRKIREINTGIYIFKTEILKGAIGLLENNNAQSEYYLTDIVKIVTNRMKGTVVAMKFDDSIQFTGINNRTQLVALETEMLKIRMKDLMESGVRLIRPESIYIEEDVCIDPDVTIYPGSIIKNGSSIGSGTQIIGGYIENSTIGKNCSIKSSYLLNSIVGNNVIVGPYDYLTGTKNQNDEKG